MQTLPRPVRSVLLLRCDFAGSPPRKLGIDEATLAGRGFRGGLLSLIRTGLGKLAVMQALLKGLPPATAAIVGLG